MRRLAAGSRIAALVAAAGLCACARDVLELSPARRPVCPRASERDGSGRCVCAREDLLLLGACVPPSVADAYCGPAASAGAAGCAFRPCAPGERLDVATGACTPGAPMADAARCPRGTLPILSDGRVYCGSPDATCPRGSSRSASVCMRSPECPAGTLLDAGSCRPVVVSSPGGPLVDVGSWAAVVLGIDGGFGSADVCRPFMQRPSLFRGGPPRGATVRIRVLVRIPDQDVTQLYADVDARDADDQPLSPGATGVAVGSVNGLLELLRSVGGVATTAALTLSVTCPFATGAAPP